LQFDTQIFNSQMTSFVDNAWATFQAEKSVGVK